MSSLLADTHAVVWYLQAAPELANLESTLAQPRSGFQPVSFSYSTARVMRLIPRDLVPGMPDRMIAATALELGLPLVTRDHRIRAASIQTIW